MLVFFESLSYTSSEIGLTRIFHLRPMKILQFFKFLEKSKPFNVKKKIVSDFDEAQNMKSFWPKDSTNETGISYFEFRQNWGRKISLS